MENTHSFWWNFLLKKELTQIYVSAALRYFAVSLIGIFIPLYLHKEIGYSLSSTLYFFIFYSLVFAIITPLAAKFASHYGMKHAVFLSVPFYLIFVGLLYLLPSVDIPLMLIAAILGISQSFYWIGMHLIFHRASDKKHRGEEVGIKQAVSISATIFGPLLGGFLIVYFSFNILFALASIVLLSSALVLFLSKENHLGYNFSLRSVISSRDWKNTLFFVSRGTGVIAMGVIWPLFIFFILDNYFLLGVVGAIIPAISAILLWVVGKYSDHIGKRKIIRWIAGFESISWLIKAFVITAGHVFAATIFGAITRGVQESPLSALEYDKARKDIAGYFVNREIFVCLGRILLLTFVLMTNSLSGGLIFHGFANLLALLF